MGTLNPYVKINKHPLGRWVSIKSWFHWKLQMSKMPWGKIYRHFWRKRLMKRIIEISNEINRHSMCGTREPIGHPIIHPTGVFTSSVGLGVVEPKEAHMVLPKDLV